MEAVRVLNVRAWMGSPQPEERHLYRLALHHWSEASEVPQFHGDNQIPRLETEILDIPSAMGGEIESEATRRLHREGKGGDLAPGRQPERGGAHPAPTRGNLGERAPANVALAHEDHPPDRTHIDPRQRTTLTERQYDFGEPETDKAPIGAIPAIDRPQQMGEPLRMVSWGQPPRVGGGGEAF